MTKQALTAAGQAFHDARAARMLAVNEGLTATHNRMDDPEEHDPAIINLRNLHDAMDATVLQAYAWQDSIPLPAFELEWPGNDDDRPGPWRRRWPEADRARVLEFLWQLNETESATQSAAGKPAKGKVPSRAKAPRKPSASRLALPGRDLLEIV